MVRRSVDSRKKISPREREIKLVYNVHVQLSSKDIEQSILRKKKDNVTVLEDCVPYQPSHHTTQHVSQYKPHHTQDTPPTPGGKSNTTINRPIVIGSGPAGLFAAYTLLMSGYKPIIIEQGIILLLLQSYTTADTNTIILLRSESRTAQC